MSYARREYDYWLELEGICMAFQHETQHEPYHPKYNNPSSYKFNIWWKNDYLPHINYYYVNKIIVAWKEGHAMNIADVAMPEWYEKANAKKLEKAREKSDKKWRKISVTIHVK
jgi:hypothetical protein